MAINALLRAACLKLGVNVEQVLSYKIYEDVIALVVEPGPKHVIPLDELQSDSVAAPPVPKRARPPKTRGKRK